MLIKPIKYPPETTAILLTIAGLLLTYSLAILAVHDPQANPVPTLAFGGVLAFIVGTEKQLEASKWKWGTRAIGAVFLFVAVVTFILPIISRVYR